MSIIEYLHLIFNVFLGVHGLGPCLYNSILKYTIDMLNNRLSSGCVQHYQQYICYILVAVNFIRWRKSFSTLRK